MSPIKVIILAAGIGKRLGPENANRPKCLLTFDGLTLLHRHLTYLQHYPVTEIIIVCGYRKELIEAEIDAFDTEIPVTTIFNQDYTLGSVVSFWCASKFLKSGDDIILMDADVLYDPRILDALLATRHKNCFLLDRSFESGDEPVKLCISNGSVVEFRKQIDKDLEFNVQGESVGFFRFDPRMAGKLADRAQTYLDHNRQKEPYEEVIRDLLLSEQTAFSYEDITGLPWLEIDFPEDIKKAQQVLQKMRPLEYQN